VKRNFENGTKSILLNYNNYSADPYLPIRKPVVLFESKRSAGVIE
jgi:hypothetical protein